MKVRKVLATLVAAFAIIAGGVAATAPAANAWMGSPGVIKTQYPSTGGTWQYGFKDAANRSYYTVNKNHGSTVENNRDSNRSVCTASGVKSIAEKWNINSPGAWAKYNYRTC